MQLAGSSDAACESHDNDRMTSSFIPGSVVSQN
jgi:hypothetical protein